MKNRAFGHGAIQHFFQANRLRGELDVVIQPLALGSMLVFDGVRRAIGEKFHHIAFTDQSYTVAPHRQRGFNTPATISFMVDTIDLFMFRIAARSVDVVCKLAFHVNQPATARAVGPVVKGGKRNQVGVNHMGVEYHLCQSALDEKLRKADV